MKAIIVTHKERMCPDSSETTGPPQSFANISNAEETGAQARGGLEYADSKRPEDHVNNEKSAWEQFATSCSATAT